jgi:exosortase E/protease (VPEID-CTERM system)
MSVPSTPSADDSRHPPWQAFAARVAIIAVEAGILAGLFGGTLRALRNDLEDVTGFNRWRIVVLAFTAILLFHARRHVPDYRSSGFSPRRLAANGLAFVALLAGLGGVSAGAIEPALGLHGQLLLAMALASAWLASVVGLWVPRGADALPLLGSLAGITAMLWGMVHLEDFTQLFWDMSGGTTVDLVERLLAPFAGGPVVRPEPFVIGTEAFRVKIKSECGGFQGIGLITTMLAGYLWWFRGIHRFPQSFLLFPVGILLIWMANVLRITALILVGIWIDPKIAVDGFHSQAGWITFLIVGLGTIWVAQQMRFFTLVVPADAGLPAGGAGSSDHAITSPSPVPTAGSPLEPGALYGPSTVACLLPFLVLTAVTILTQAFTSGFNYLYPLRVIAVAAVLWSLRRHYAPGPEPFSIVALAIGVVTFLVWMALAPGYGLEDPEKVAAMDPAQLGQPWALLWLLFRVAGYTITVPIAEELVFRGFLARRLIDDDVERVPVGTFTWLSFLASSLAFGLMHGGDWQRATLAGLAFALALYQRRRLSDAIVAHATINACLAGYVIATGSWTEWG